jgi:hypothetical protein
MIGGVIKYFRFSYEDVLWNMSYANVNMLLASIPSYETGIDKKDTVEKPGKMDELENFFKD